MELKHYKAWFDVFNPQSSNRTFMELKHKRGRFDLSHGVF